MSMHVCLCTEIDHVVGGRSLDDDVMMMMMTTPGSEANRCSLSLAVYTQRHTCRHTVRRTDGQTDRQANRQGGRDSEV